MSFSTILNFSLLRIIKNKFFIISSSTFLGFFILLNIVLYAVIKNPFSVCNIALTITVIFSIFWISTININNIINFFIKDEKTGIQGLEIRRGVKPINIVLPKILAINVIILSYIFLVYLISAVVPLMFYSNATKLIETKSVVGTFALIPFHILLFSFILLMTVIFKSNKISISLNWIFTMLLAMVNILGPIWFSFKRVDTTNLPFIDVNYYYANKILTSNSFDDTDFSEIYDGYQELATNGLFSISGEADYKYKFRYALDSFALKRGLLLDYYAWIKAGTFIDLFTNYFDKLTLPEDVNFATAEITTAELETVASTLEANSYFQFLKKIERVSENLSDQEVQESFFANLSRKNVTGTNQLNDVLDNNISIVDKTWLKDLNDLTIDYFTNYKGIKNIMQSGYNVFTNFNRDEYKWGTEFDLYVNIAQWKAQNHTTMGMKMYIYLLTDLLDGFKSLKGVPYEFNTQLEPNYIANPIMWFYEMVYFSGTPNFVYDTFSIYEQLLPVADFRNLTYENNKMVYKRNLMVGLNYVGFIGLGTIFLITSVVIFNKRIYVKGGLD